MDNVHPVDNSSAGDGPVRPGATSDAGVPAAAAEAFDGRTELAGRYAELLATTGVERGLLGPREAGRVWDRHLLNCAAITELIPPESEVIDVGSGAGLPGIVLAIARPDLRITLVESLLRRTRFLEDVVDELGLHGVRVWRGRAEQAAGVMVADVVTARAVAPLERLLGWLRPLVRPGGVVLAMKGDDAERELAEARGALRGVARADVVRVGQSRLGFTATVVRVATRTSSGQRRHHR